LGAKNRGFGRNWKKLEETGRNWKKLEVPV
jgi:hypothetical protein